MAAVAAVVHNELTFSAGLRLGHFHGECAWVSTLRPLRMLLFRKAAAAVLMGAVRGASVCTRKRLELHVEISVLVQGDQGNGRIVAVPAAITGCRENSHKPAAVLNLKAIADNLMRSDNKLQAILLAKLLSFFAGKRVQRAAAIARARMTRLY